MMKSIFLAFCLCLAAPASAGQVASGIVLEVILQCGSPAARTTGRWKNPYRQSIYLRETHGWIGVDFDTYPVDLYMYPIIKETGFQFKTFAWDYYANPSQPITFSKSYRPDYVELGPGQHIEVEFYCLKFRRSPTSVEPAPAAHFKFGVDFTWTPDGVSQ